MVGPIFLRATDDATTVPWLSLFEGLGSGTVVVYVVDRVGVRSSFYTVGIAHRVIYSSIVCVLHDTQM